MRDFELKKRQIVERVDLVALASEDVRMKRSGRRWVGLCPFHAEKTPSFVVSQDVGLFKCFGCGKGGDVFSYVQARENVSFMEAMRILADRAGVKLDEAPSGSSGEPDRVELAKVNAWALTFFRSNLLNGAAGRHARAYLQSRGISEAIAERFNLGLATDGGQSLRDAAGRARITFPLLHAADLVRADGSNRVYPTFRNRLMFPIRDATGRVVGFGGRTLVGDQAKYLNTRQNALFDKGRGLYGIELARQAIAQCGRAVVVEGYTDCIAAHQAGCKETVASLGTAMTAAQVDLLHRYSDQLILLFDSDKAGEAAAERAIVVAVPRGVHVRLARIPSGKDPDEFLRSAGAAGFCGLLDAAVDALEFKWGRLQAQFAAHASDGAHRAAHLEFLRLVGTALAGGDEIQTGLVANRVARLVGLDGREVYRLMTRLRHNTPRSSPQ